MSDDEDVSEASSGEGEGEDYTDAEGIAVPLPDYGPSADLDYDMEQAEVARILVGMPGTSALPRAAVVDEPAESPRPSGIENTPSKSSKSGSSVCGSPGGHNDVPHAFIHAFPQSMSTDNSPGLLDLDNVRAQEAGTRAYYREMRKIRDEKLGSQTTPKVPYPAGVATETGRVRPSRVSMRPLDVDPGRVRPTVTVQSAGRDESFHTPAGAGGGEPSAAAMGRGKAKYTGMVRLGQYDGVSMPLAVFLHRFEGWSVYNDWTEKDRAFFLSSSLSGIAAHVLWEPEALTSCDSLIQTLKKRFGTAQQEKRFEHELKSRRRRKGETLQSLYMDIKRLLMLVYPGKTGDYIEKAGVEAFIGALLDIDITDKLRENDPKTLDEALSMTTKLEVIKLQKVMDRAVAAVYDEQNRLAEETEVPKVERESSKKREAFVRSSGVTESEERALAELRREMAECKKEMERMRIGVATPMPQGPQTASGPPGTPYYSAPSTPYSTPPQYVNPAFTSPGQVYMTPAAEQIVNQPGQFSPPGQYGQSTPYTQPSPYTQQSPYGPVCQVNPYAQGPYAQQGSSQGPYQQQNTQGSQPYSGKKPWNKSSRGRGGGSQGPSQGYSQGPSQGASQGSPRLCYKCGDPGHFQNRCPQNETSTNTSSGGPRPAAGASSMRWSTAVPETYLEIEVDNCKYTCLLDTGCDHSLIPLRLVPDLPLIPVDMDVFAANGTKINILGGLECKFKVNGKYLVTRVLVSDEVYEFMLGYDFLVDHGAKWNFVEKTLTINGEDVPLKIRESRVGVRRIYVRDSTVILPNTEQNVPVKMIHNTFRTPRADWVVQPKALAEKVYLARVLLPHQGECAVRVANLSRHPFKIEGGLEVGKASVAKVLCTQGPNNVSRCSSATSDNKLDYSFLSPIFESLPTDLDNNNRKDIEDFIIEYQDVFSRSEYDLGRTNLMQHHIETGDARPIRQALRRHPQVYLDVIDKEIEKMANSGVVEPSCSPWASNVVVVTKSDKTPRITLDYRMLNNVTKKDSYPLPNIAECLDAFKGASYFGVLDLRSSFYQVPLAEEDRDKTAFITRRGQWRFRSLPMGLCNSPGTFQRLMDLVLRGLTWISVLVYIDDIVVFADSQSELKERLREVFNRLRQANLKLKPSKVKLFQTEITFLGHKISKAGIAMDTDKVAEVVNWPVPQNLHEVRQFLGLCGYYRRYVRDYSKHAAPLHELTRKLEPFS